MQRDTLKNNRGISLVELIITIGIFSLIVSAMGLFQADVFSFNRILQTGLSNQQEAKKIIRPFANEVRGAVQSDLGGYPIETTEESNFTFFSDINSDGFVERIRYFYEDGNLKKGIIEPDHSTHEYTEENEDIIKIIHDISDNVVFYYYGSNYDGSDTSEPLEYPVTPGDVRLVKVIVEIDSSPGVAPDAYIVTTQVSLRNVKDNL